MSRLRHEWSPWDRRSLLVIAGVWTTIALLSAGSTAAARARSGASARIAESLLEAGLACAIFAALTPFALRAGQLLPMRAEGAVRRLATHSGLALAYWALCAALTMVAAPLSSDAQPLQIADAITSTAFGALLTYAVTVGVAQFTDTSLRLRNQERQRSSLALELSQAQMRALTGQLRPHFLFNALNALSALIRKDPVAAERLVLDLGRLLRMSLDRNDRPEVMLSDEIAFVQAYLSVMRARIGDRLGVEYEVPADLLPARVPQLLILPLVENALKHGITRAPDSGQLTIAASRAGDRLRISVTDDGPGPPDELIEGFGISATRSRLSHHFGADQDFRLAPVAPHGATATIDLPLRYA